MKTNPRETFVHLFTISVSTLPDWIWFEKVQSVYVLLLTKIFCTFHNLLVHILKYSPVAQLPKNQFLGTFMDMLYRTIKMRREASRLQKRKQLTIIIVRYLSRSGIDSVALPKIIAKNNTRSGNHASRYVF